MFLLLLPFGWLTTLEQVLPQSNRPNAVAHQLIVANLRGHSTGKLCPDQIGTIYGHSIYNTYVCIYTALCIISASGCAAHLSIIIVNIHKFPDLRSLFLINFNETFLHWEAPRIVDCLARPFSLLCCLLFRVLLCCRTDWYTANTSILMYWSCKCLRVSECVCHTLVNHQLRHHVFSPIRCSHVNTLTEDRGLFLNIPFYLIRVHTYFYSFISTRSLQLDIF